jgi:hypothetical protein
MCSLRAQESIVAGIDGSDAAINAPRVCHWSRTSGATDLVRGPAERSSEHGFRPRADW